MSRLSNRPKCPYQYRANGDKDRADEGVPGKRFTQDQGRKGSVKDEAGLYGISSAQHTTGNTDRLKRRENG